MTLDNIVKIWLFSIYKKVSRNYILANITEKALYPEAATLGKAMGKICHFPKKLGIFSQNDPFFSQKIGKMTKVMLHWKK